MGMDLYRPARSKKRSGDRRKPDGSPRSFRNSRDRLTYTKTETRCADCSVMFEPPFTPRQGRPVYCSRCFRYHRDADDDDGRSSSPPPPDRRQGHKTTYDRPRYKDNRSSSPPPPDRRQGHKTTYDRRQMRYENNDSRQPKQEQKPGTDSHAGFYDSMREKLFAILGGKVCSGCGYRDERALGFSHIYGDISFDKIRRGGTASAWGKYISNSDTAQKELKVLCLNCNEIRQPITRSKNSRLKPKRNTKQFPR